jgi:hypothetical protein
MKVLLTGPAGWGRSAFLCTFEISSPLRRDEVFLVKKLGYEGWKQLKIQVEDG